MLKKVIFLGGPSHLASVRIRCIQVANSLGCDYITGVNSLQNIPREKEIFICVKPFLTPEAFETLQKRGIVVFDIHDNYCPPDFIDYYLVSSQGAYQKFKSYGQTHIIPHHHCNFSGFPNALKLQRTPTWIGSPEWVPSHLDFKFETYNDREMTPQEIVGIYRHSTLLLNLRASTSRTLESVSEHIRTNPGVKLINSIGFGVPSISDREPAYLEIGPKCTIFVESSEDCKYWAIRLQQDDDLYTRLRNNCILKAPQYSLAKITKQYLNFLMHEI